MATSDFTAVGTVTTPSLLRSDVRLTGETGWTRLQVRGADGAFRDASTLTFGSRDDG